MPYQATVFNVLIASPGDVQDERNIVREVVQEWNAVNSKSREIILNAVGWETHSHPTMGDRAQGVLNKQLVDEADLVVAVFWTRIGSPTGEAPGGSVEELSRHMDAGKPAMVYFSSQPVEPDKADTQQYRDLKNFRDTWCEPRGLVQRYKTTDEFRKMFARHIAQKVNDDPYLQKHVRTNAGLMPIHVMSQPARQTPPISEEAKALLFEAVKDAQGIIMYFKTMDGEEMATNKKNFIEDNNPRSSATWESALDELIGREWVKGIGKKGEVFKVTREGYEMADLLQTK